MLIYQVLFSDSNYYYVELYDCNGKENLKIPVNQFDDWCNGKIER